MSQAVLLDVRCDLTDSDAPQQELQHRAMTGNEGVGLHEQRLLDDLCDETETQRLRGFVEQTPPMMRHESEKHEVVQLFNSNV